MQYSERRREKGGKSLQSQERGGPGQKEEGGGKAGKEEEQVKLDCQRKRKIN